MLSVRCPTIFMAVDRGTPAHSRFRTAVRRKSWGTRSGIPAFLHAVTHARRKDLIRTPEVSGSPLLAIPGFAAWAAETPSRFPDPIIWAPFNAQDLIASPKEAINVFDFEPIARENVPPVHFGYMASGIDDEVTLRANREGFLKFQLRPRRLNDAHSRETFSQPLHDSTRARLAHRGHAGSLRVTQLEGTGAASPDYGGSLSPKGVRPHQNRS